MKTRICKNCGKTYDTPYPHSVFCSQQCYLEYRGKIRPSTHIKRHSCICLWCHGEFNSIKTSARFCSAEHRELYNAVKIQIMKKFYWSSENDRRQAELAKLTILGMHYTEKCKLKKSEFSFPTEPLRIVRESHQELP